MFKIHALTIFLLFLSLFSAGQSVGIGTETPNPNAILELVAPENDQGLLVPRLSTAERTASTFTSNLSTSDNGLMVYDADLNKFFFWINDQWVELAVGNLSGLPDQTTQTGKFLSTDGSVALWSDLDFNSLANVPLDLADGDDVDDADADATNEIQDLTLAGTDLTISSGSTVDLSGLQDGTGTDDQGAGEVAVVPTTDLVATDVQSALEELQAEVLGVSSASIPDDAITTSKILDGAITDSKISDLDFGKLTSVPTGLSDGDDDTQLSDADIAGFGYLKTVPDDVVSTAKLSDGAVTDAKISDMDFTKLTSVPAGLADGDDDTQLSDTDIAGFGYLKAEVDGSITNEIQDISFDGSNLSLTSGSTIDLTSLQDGTGTDDQVAGEVGVTPSGDLASSDVQAALEELQSEIVAAASSAIPDNAVTTVKISNGAVTDAKISDVDFSKLTSVPAGLSDGDDDTQLDETDVDAFVANNGYLTSEADPTVPASIKDGIDWTELSSIPAGIADGDDDTQLDETTVDGFVANNGYLTSVATGDIANNAVTNAKISSLAYSKLTGVPAGLDDGDDDTQLDETAVDGFVANNGYLTSVATGDIANNAVTNAKISSVAYSKLTGVPAGLDDGDDDTQLDETAVDAFVANNGYLTTVNTANIASGAVTNIKISSMAYSKLTGVPAGLDDGDDDTQLDETAVDAFVANNGFLTSVTTTNITNGTILNADISNSAAIDGSKLASNTVTATQIATGGVGTSEILNSTITNTDISASAAINGTKIASNTITATQIATSGVGTSEILNGTIVNADISSSAAIAGSKISPNFGSSTVTGGSFNYSSSQARSYSISPLEFVALTGIVEPHRITYSSGGEALAVSGNSSSVQVIGAPVRLPDGATVVQIELVGRNFSGTAGVNVNWVENSQGTVTTPTLLFKIPSGTSGSTLFDSGTVSLPIDNSTYSYQLTMEADAISGGGHTVSGVVITYVVSSPD